MRFSRLPLAVLGTALATAIALPAEAQRRVYAGSEAQALQCAAYYSYTSKVMELRGLLSTRTAEQGTQIALYILDRHVSGSRDQKMAAYKVMLNRMPVSDLALFEETNERIGWCQKRFLS